MKSLSPLIPVLTAVGMAIAGGMLLVGCEREQPPTLEPASDVPTLPDHTGAAEEPRVTEEPIAPTIKSPSDTGLME